MAKTTSAQSMADPRKEDLPAFKMAEIGTTGISVIQGEIQEEMKVDLAFPNSAHTYKLMTYDSAVSSALGIIEVLVQRSTWDVKPPENPTPEELERTEFIKSCMSDMDRPWAEYVEEFLSYLIYGYSNHEMVFKKRKGKNSNTKYPSKYEDEKIGWAKLPVRSQTTIDKWVYDNDKATFVGMRQNLSLVNRDAYYYLNNQEKSFEQYRLIPFSKLLRFRWNTKRDNPEGQSPLRSCYISWKYKTRIEELEAIGISRDLGGLPVVSIPPEYMAEEASDEKKAIYEYFKNMIRNLQANESAGVIMPKFVDPQTKQDMFEFKLEGSSGGKNYDTSPVISRYENKILMAFFADILKMGQDSVGSFALSDNKNNLLAFMVEAQLKLITEVLNNQLIPTTFRLNGWEEERLPEFTYGDIEDIDLEAVSKFVQRIVSVGAVEVDKELSNKLRDMLDLKPAEKANKMDDELIAGGASRSGDGMAGGSSGSGTGKADGSSGDSSTNNSDNKA